MFTPMEAYLLIFLGYTLALLGAVRVLVAWADYRLRRRIARERARLLPNVRSSETWPQRAGGSI